MSEGAAASDDQGPLEPFREALPNRRRTEREKIVVDGLSIYVEVGFYPDGRVGEIFLTAGKKGAKLRELLDGFSIALSVSLQYGVPLSAFSVASEDSELTGRANKMLREIFTKIEELSHEEVRGRGDPVPSTAATGDQPTSDPGAGGPPSTPHP